MAGRFLNRPLQCSNRTKLPFGLGSGDLEYAHRMN
jgi:hypothetical protein